MKRTPGISGITSSSLIHMSVESLVGDRGFTKIFFKYCQSFQISWKSKSTDSSSVISQHKKHDKIYNNAHQIKLLKSKDKGKILKASREKKTH